MAVRCFMPPGQLRRVAVLEAGEPDQFDEVHGALLALFLRHALPFESVTE